MNDKFQNRIYSFGEFRLDTAEHALHHGTEKISLTNKAIELLILLIDRRGQTLSKQELMDALWQDTFVDENNLAVTVSMLRKAFGESSFDKKFIETVPKRGYRFVADVEETNTDLLIEKQTLTRITIEEKESQSLKSGLRRHTLALAVIFVALAGLGVFLFLSSWNFPANQKASSQKTDAPRTLAVLPLKNLSSSEDEPLSVGLTDALITRLGNIGGLAVRPTSAVLPFAGSAETPKAIGEKLNVETVLESSIQRLGNRLRVSVQLVKTTDSSILWSENFDEMEDDLFKIQDSISAHVADTFRLKNERTANLRTDDAEAYKLYLRGRHAWNKRTPDGFNESIKLFNQAIDRDAAFASAFAGLADAYALLSEYSVAPPVETFPKAKAAANRALEISPDLAEAHATLAYALASYDWNFAESERQYRRAIELNPNYATAHQWYGELLMGLQRYDEAEREYQRAGELDPFSPIIQADVGLLLFYRRDYDAARAQYQKTIRNFPDFPVAYAQLTLVNERQQKYDEAVDSTIEFLRLSGLDENSRSALRGIYKQHGYSGFMQTFIAGANAKAQKHYVSAFTRAFLYARLGDRENTLIWAEKAFAERHRYVAYINADPDFDFLRDDTRFQDLIRRVGLEN